MGDSRFVRRSSKLELPGLERELSLSQALSRRDILKIAGYSSLAAFLAACGVTSTTTTNTGTGGSLNLGSNESDPGPKKGMEAIVAAFTAANGGTKVKLNTVDHGTFQDQISSYLQATPDDAFTWFSGHRMRFFAAQGLATPIDDVWDSVKSNFTGAFAESVKGDDGHFYGIPRDYYPWCVFYRKSVFAAHSYKIPTNWDDFTALAAQMQKDGLTPISMGDKDGWPAQGTFDIINLRLNGYQFHVELCAGKQKWTDPRVTAVFKKWADLAKYYQAGLAGTTWQQAADMVVRKQAGMYLLGLFVSDQFKAAGQDALDDLDFFPFPDLGTQYDAEKALDAPIDIWMVTKKSPTLNADLAQAKAWMTFWAKGSTQLTMFQNAPGLIPTASDADTSSYSPLQKKAAQIISNAKRITQFFDRDSRPDFAGANGMQSFLLTYLQNPNADTTSLQGKMQSFWDSLPPEK
ncbi:MAG TPA: ABC transporter substrate-binding protein [Candidatus Dormibacteraeota bacterium]|nr:ABC transporter substrate-binding protein [Candidatus Dormibacteraeota bacterium]